MESSLTLTDRLADQGYWVATAARRLEQGKYSEVVSLCLEGLEIDPNLISGRLIYAQALHRSGQAETAAEHLRRVLALDPENIVALKFLGDIRFDSGETGAALANYGRVLEIDPFCRGLKSQIECPSAYTTRTITLTRRSETRAESPELLRDIPFFTETIGDLYLTQGYPRLAACVFRTLVERGDSPRIAEKLALAEGKVKEREKDT
jgi:tetratricopeptide (TPR) repeat protein